GRAVARHDAGVGCGERPPAGQGPLPPGLGRCAGRLRRNLAPPAGKLGRKLHRSRNGRDSRGQRNGRCPTGMSTQAPWRAMGLKDEEYRRILELLGREPNRVELGMFAVLWYEHCAYKHSKLLLKRFPTKGEAVVVGPGEN